ncbi:CC171 protein, partial [Notiomystis cincta]|nr:CC171 protein [Notiomystis cincta]
NPSEMDNAENLRRKLHQVEKKNLELTNLRNRDASHYQKEIIKLRMDLERGESLRRHLESEMTFTRKEAHMQMYSAEDELCDVK